MTGHASDKTVGDAFRENQDAVITTMALLGVVVAVRRECHCANCRAFVAGHALTVGELSERLEAATGVTHHQIADLMVGATRRIVKGVPS